ncbi:hypothetical protein FB446DRAFT_795316 [Lentinula raphanica]|nr:hypothetical protein FB446DRAFT_795316 [Lentinula raphanica]
MRTWVHTYYRSRITRLLSKVFPVPRHQEFFNVLHAHHSRIGGSFAYAIVDSSSVFVPDNINILSPAGQGDSFRDVLVAKWGCTVESNGPSRDPVSPDVFAPTTIHMKTAEGFTLTITESDDLSLMSLMLTGYTTAECVLVGGHTFTLLYPLLVENGEVLRLPSVERPIPERALDTVAARFKLLDSTEHLGRPCGESCPNIWRRSLGMRGSATLYWGGFKAGKDTRLKSADEGPDSVSENIYESSEAEREDWQDEIDREQDWPMNVVGVEVANGDEIHNIARAYEYGRQIAVRFNDSSDPSTFAELGGKGLEEQPVLRGSRDEVKAISVYTSPSAPRPGPQKAASESAVTTKRSMTAPMMIPGLSNGSDETITSVTHAPVWLLNACNALDF